MLRFDIALQAIKRRLAAKPARTGPQAEIERPAGGILIPFPLRKLSLSDSIRPKRRAPG